MKVEVEIKKMQTGFANILVKWHLKLEAIKEECLRLRERKSGEDKKIKSALQACSLIILGVLILYPEYELCCANKKQEKR